MSGSGQHPMFPDPSPGPARKVCDWCARTEDVRPVEVEPARWGKAANGTPRVLKKRPITAMACKRCATRMFPTTSAPQVRK